MNSPFLSLRLALAANPRTWLVTGAAGFIGSNLTETLLELDQKVVGLDNLATGHLRNLDQIKAKVSPSRWSNFKFIQGDISNLDDCRTAVISPFDDKQAVTYVLHQAALGSVPRSLADPITTNSINIGGFLNMLVAARDAGVASFVYAASSSTYGDSPHLPKTEAVIGNPLSPYAVTKYVNELYADVFARSYGFKTIGLRYFNVFGPRQDPNGAYAAVIPRWISALVNGTPVQINGDGETSRDFCYIANVVQANLLAATSESPEAWNQVYNVAIGDQTDLNTLYRSIQSALEREIPNVREQKPIHSEFRAGDVRHSRADISKAQRLLGYAPTHRFGDGLISTVEWHLAQSRKAGNRSED